MCSHDFSMRALSLFLESCSWDDDDGVVIVFMFMECRLDELGANAVMGASFASSSRNDRYLECGVMMPVLVYL